MQYKKGRRAKSDLVDVNKQLLVVDTALESMLGIVSEFDEAGCAQNILFGPSLLASSDRLHDAVDVASIARPLLSNQEKVLDPRCTSEILPNGRVPVASKMTSPLRFSFHVAIF